MLANMVGRRCRKAAAAMSAWWLIVELSEMMRTASALAPSGANHRILQTFRNTRVERRDPDSERLTGFFRLAQLAQASGIAHVPQDANLGEAGKNILEQFDSLQRKFRRIY